MLVVEYLSLLTLGLVGMGAMESVAHRWRLGRIPFRIHVSGTRGKSSVTRLIASGLREAGIKTAAKTTGTLARMILPDGREIPVFRPAGANIIEQKRIVAAAAALDVQAIVIECMALQPELHWISERMLVRATHGVITNIRPDHLDVMGPTTTDVAKAIAGMIPVGGKLFTAERKYLDILRRAADDRQTSLVAVTTEEIRSITAEELDGFPYTEHAENVALCLKVLADFGIERGKALTGLWKARPDPGVLSVHALDFFGRCIVFVNAFAANDPESTARIWGMMRARYPDVKYNIAVLNLREDRPARTLQLAREATFWQDADRVVLMGSGAYLFSKIASEHTSYPASRFIYAEQESVEQVFERIVDVCGASALVVGMGNIGGLGLPLVRFFRNRCFLPDKWQAGENKSEYRNSKSETDT